MKLDLRFALPAALASVALAVPASTAVADPPPDNVYCPNTTQWVLVPTAIAPDPSKDNNGDGLVCQKVDPDNPSKDNNNPEDWIDNNFPYAP